MEPKKPGPKGPTPPEVLVMKRIAALMGALEEDQVRRVAAWVKDCYGPKRAAGRTPPAGVVLFENVQPVISAE